MRFITFNAQCASSMVLGISAQSRYYGTGFQRGFKHISLFKLRSDSCIDATYYMNINTLISRSFSSKKSNPKVKGKNSSKNSPSKVRTKSKEDYKVPTSGYIGKTRFDLIPKHFAGQLPTLIGQGVDLQNLLNLTIQAHDKIISNHGVIEGTAKWKAITLYATGLLEGRDPDNPGWVATGKVNKWPRVISHLLPLFVFVKDNIFDKEKEKEIAEVRRLLLTLFKLNIVCTANSEIDKHLVTIKGKFKIQPELIADFEAFARNKLSGIREEITLTDLSFDMFLGPNNGPNGDVKLSSALQEATVLEKDEHLYSAFKELCIITNNTHFLDFFSQCAKKYRDLPSQLSHIILRKLTAIPDKGNKSRLIALVDFWTQSVLAAVEEKVLEVTKALYENHCCFWSHNQGWADILAQPEEIQGTLASLDAESWTDNFPASLQQIVVKALFGQKLADAWKHLVVTCPWHVPHKSQPVYYGKGQGMGTKGSFAIAQLTDLIFVEYVYSKQYPNIINPYFMKVGDDLILQDPELKFSSWYSKLGVPINFTKSKFKTSYGNFNEFVSRNSWNNIDYSIISPKLISKFLRDDHYATTLYNHIKERVADRPSFMDMLSIKEDVKASKPNFDLERHRSARTKLLKIVTWLDIINPDPILKGSEFIYSPPKEEILLLLENLILVTLGEFCIDSENLINDKEQQSLTMKVKDLLGEFYHSNKDLLLDNDTKNFYQVCLSNRLTFKEVVTLRQAMPILRSKEEKYKQGHMTYALDQQLIFPPLVADSTGSYIPNPEFIEHMLQMQALLKDATQGYKTLRRGPLFAKSKPRNVKDLFRLMNIIVERESKILDINNCVYDLPKGDQKVLNPTYVGGYLAMFKFHDMLSQIESIRSDIGAEVLICSTTRSGESG